MTPARRSLKIAKWTAAGLLFLLAGLWMLSVFADARLRLDEHQSGFPQMGGGRTMRLSRGALLFAPYWPISSRCSLHLRKLDLTRLGFNSFPLYPGVRLYGGLSLPQYGRSTNGQWCYFPLLLPTLIALLATAALFLLDRRRIPPGHCRCGYNLTGNTTGRCPECGTEITWAQT